MAILSFEINKVYSLRYRYEIANENISRKLFLRVHLGYDIQTFWRESSEFVTYQGDNLGNPNFYKRESPSLKPLLRKQYS